MVTFGEAMLANFGESIPYSPKVCVFVVDNPNLNIAESAVLYYLI